MYLALSLLRSNNPVTFNPDANNLPGLPVIDKLTSGLEGWALIAATIGILVGAIVWAFGHYSQNYQQAYNGRRGVLLSAAAAILIAGAPAIVNFFVGQGSQIH
jgi:MFS family permease